MKISVIIPVLNQYKLVAQAINYLAENAITSPELILIDNASDEGGEKLKDALFKSGIDTEKLARLSELKIIDLEQNIGTYATFKEGLKYATEDILVYMHSDVFIYQAGWDKIVLDKFEADAGLGLIGFIGSNEIDNLGGRGCGTKSNMQGRETKTLTNTWKGSPAESHGRRITTLETGAVVDGCVMILRKDCLSKLERVEDFPLHHFYDRLISCQVLEKGYRVGVLGIEFDHISGQTVCHEGKHYTIAEQKMIEKFSSREQWEELRKVWMNNAMNPSRGKKPDTGDYWTYLEAEWRFLSEWRERRHFIPLRVDNNYLISR